MTATSLPRVTDATLARQDLFIDGAWAPASSNERKPVVDPATREVVAEVATATREDAQRAIAAASTAFPAWAATTAKERAVVLRRWFELMVEHVDDLAAILTAEQGKPIAEARAEILYGAGFVEWYAEEGKRAYGEVIPTNASDRRLVVIKQPVGVCAAITPWNFPAAMIQRKVSPALAAGCTTVVKPSSETPLSALALAELASRAGFPPGVLNVVHGSRDVVGDELVTSRKVRKLTFTGSTEVGKSLMAQAAGTLKRISLELGGNAPLIVFDDADLTVALEGAIASKFRNSGQTCVCANRLLVQSGVHDEFVERLAQAASALQVGNGFEEGVEQGPLITESAVAKVEAHLADAVDHGGRVVAGGSRHALGGTFFEPTVLVGATPEMRLATEETFGPLAPVFRFDTEEEAIQLANETESGLASYLFTRDAGRIWRVGEALEFGVVGINTGLVSYEGAPFGGVKESGIGREGSRHGLDDFLELKYLCMGAIT